MSALIEFDEVCKYYQMGDTLVKAADHISMKIERGEFVAIVGQSGSGKSTCMNIIGCLDVPTAGTYKLNGRDVGRMSRDELAEIRNELLGFIFQQYNLLPKLSLMENVDPVKSKLDFTKCKLDFMEYKLGTPLYSRVLQVWFPSARGYILGRIKFYSQERETTLLDVPEGTARMTKSEYKV